MKQIIRYISIVVLLMTSAAALARGGVEAKVEIATLTNGTITSSLEGLTCTLTVTPAAGYYIRKGDITVQKTVDPSTAKTRGDINVTDKLSLTGDDPEALSAARTYTFDIPEGYNAYVTASFTACSSISLSVSMSGWTYGSEASSPIVTGNTGNAPVSYSYAASGSTDFTATKPVNVGEYTVKATVPAISIYTAAEATASFAITAANTPADPEPNTEVVNTEDPVTVGDETFYQPSQTVQDAISNNVNTGISFSVEASKDVKVNENGGLEFGKSDKNVDVALTDMHKGETVTFNIEGTMQADASKLKEKGAAAGARRTRTEGKIDLVSGKEYEVLEDGNIVITVVLTEAPATINSIKKTEAPATGIELIHNSQFTIDSWYMLNGQPMQGKPAKRGVYIHNGSKYVIK